MARKLNRREKIAVGLAAAVVGLIVLVEGLVFPVLERRSRLQRLIVAKTETLQQVRRLSAEYRKIRSLSRRQAQRLSRRSRDFTLFSYLDGLAGQVDVKSRITYMKPSTIRDDTQGRDLDRVEMKIQGTTMDPLVRFIHGIESSDHPIRIRRLSVTRPAKAEEGLSAVFQVEAPAAAAQPPGPPKPVRQ